MKLEAEKLPFWEAAALWYPTALRAIPQAGPARASIRVDPFEIGVIQ
jgi:hypothetical protein